MKKICTTLVGIGVLVLLTSADAGSDQLTAMTDYERAALNSINTIRVELNAGKYAEEATPNPAIGLLQWDRAMAAKAQAYSDRCVWGHSSMGYGENIAINSRPRDAIQAIALADTSWSNERQVYDVVGNKCTGVCGHWTQQIWSGTKYTGCGTSYCPTMTGISFGGWYTVCEYNPPGNYWGRAPYSPTGDKVADKWDGGENAFVLDNVLYYNVNYDVQLSLIGDTLDSMLTKAAASQVLNHHQKELRYIGEDLTLYVPHLLVGGTDFAIHLKVDLVTNVWSMVNFWVNE